ncbi:PREDICTED: late embryogenesis abundant protein At1g64065-like [Nelumbo nucifera]|uniref:Late embryogenesis abundant protein At1g64065-like n=2 Tax=Nelumbo nucifera TaxID=4432 RepID=A0A1U7ZS14_NELNU|nr:PREDICTED: late embryogenesis abundant protein At1g64065-like [Nelumbo nucifera]DAD43223.1 TPA_asm: hypothetical protein HUJ06_001453 [Nelumbo nucifera]
MANREKEQVKPLAPVADRISSDEDEATFYSKKLRRRKYIKCCGCITALLLLPAIAIIVLAFTVFRVREPEIKMNSVKIDGLELVSGIISGTSINMSLTADVSVKNPNFASFRFGNASTTVYYRGTVVAEARNPPGHAKARRTLRMNVTVDVITDRLISNPNLISDISSRMLAMSTYTRIGGRVNILKIVKRHVTVKMNCTMTVNITSQAIQDQNCRRHVKL